MQEGSQNHLRQMAARDMPRTVAAVSCFDDIDTTRFSVSITLYGIKNCDTMKKARAWLDGQGVVYAFHDYKTEGIDRAQLVAWCKAVGWETLLNRNGTTFRKLPEADRQDLDEAKAIAHMLAQPSMIKRPVLTRGAKPPLIGFKPDVYATELATHS